MRLFKPVVELHYIGKIEEEDELYGVQAEGRISRRLVHSLLDVYEVDLADCLIFTQQEAIDRFGLSRRKRAFQRRVFIGLFLGAIKLPDNRVIRSLGHFIKKRIITETRFTPETFYPYQFIVLYHPRSRAAKQ